MHFKRIEINGFKSFADPVSIDFTDGITCIVGPNGSGKSNVSDALRCLRADSGTLFAVCREGTILGYVDESRLLNAAIEDPSTQVSLLLRPSFTKAV